MITVNIHKDVGEVWVYKPIPTHVTVNIYKDVGEVWVYKPIPTHDHSQHI